jgi:hypothetical protein
MGTYVVIRPDGTMHRVPGGAKLELSRLYHLIGCRTVERTPVEFEGRARECWIDEEGLMKEPESIEWNREVRELAIDYWVKRGVQPHQIQRFAGTGVVWLPKG